MESTTEILVRYAEVDKMGMVYYSRYLEYFEIGRAEWFIKNVCNYEEMESVYKVGLPVIECNIQYKRAARYFDRLMLIVTCNKSLLPKILHFDYEIYRENELLVTGFSKHLFYNLETKKVTHVPDNFLQRISES